MRLAASAPPAGGDPAAGAADDKLYPELPSQEPAACEDNLGQRLADEAEPPGSEFRLQKICELQKMLEGERDSRAALYKKYRRAVNVADGVDTALTTVGMATGATGIALLAGAIITAPIAVALEITALACGLASVTCKFTSRKLGVKARKHDDIRVLADSKLNTILDRVSHALIDNAISAAEFRFIIVEAAKYHDMKREIRSRNRHAHAAVKMDVEEKNRLLKQGREEAQADLLQAMGGKLK